MKKILIVWIIIAVLLVGSLTFIGLKLTAKNKVYYELENKLTESAKIYYGQYPGHLPSTSLTITSDKLIKNNFLEALTLDKETCIGYVAVTKNGLFYKYQPFIKCENYTTKKYDPKETEVS